MTPRVDIRRQDLAGNLGKSVPVWFHGMRIDRFQAKCWGLAVALCLLMGHSSRAATNAIPWSFKPPKASAVPRVKAEDWPRTQADYYLLARIEARGLAPTKDAEPRTLARRLSFDLLGLPPSTEDVEAYAAAPTREAYARLVDRWLASPAFGERWARRWLDVARYAESTGKDRNYAYPEAWRYRDWVIQAFNSNLPYNRFLQLQIAGDLIPGATPRETDEHLVATGFLAIGPKGLNEQNRGQFLLDLADEQIDATTRAMLGLSFACARCHDHKSDPFTQADYYALAGVFDSTDTYYGTAVERGNRQPSGHLPLKSVPSTRFAATNTAPSTNTTPSLRRNERPFLPPGPPSGEPRTMGVQEGQPHDVALLVRGELKQRGSIVQRALPHLAGSSEPPRIPRNESGRRQLAAWIASDTNPLTARVFVNRVWHHLFGRGLAPTLDDFGVNGLPPTHPELLDTLAVEFMRNGWNTRALIRELVLSRAYQLADTAEPGLLETDPENQLVARHQLRRLEAEELRDAILRVCGTLNEAAPEGSVVSRAGDGPLRRGLRPARGESPPRHRSIYLPIVRGFVPEGLEVFDFPEPSLVIAERETTNVPLQSLYLMNSEATTSASRAWARALLDPSQSTSPASRVTTAYQAAFGRPPTPAELDRALRFLRSERSDSVATSSDRRTLRPRERAWASFCQALLASAEFRFLR